jgi:hypothetical protein
VEASGNVQRCVDDGVDGQRGRQRGRILQEEGGARLLRQDVHADLLLRAGLLRLRLLRLLRLRLLLRL